MGSWSGIMATGKIEKTLDKNRAAVCFQNFNRVGGRCSCDSLPEHRELFLQSGTSCRSMDISF